MSQDNQNMNGVTTQVGQVANNNVDQIRDILFGGQMRDYELRFARLEEKLEKEQARLASDMNSRLDSLDKFVRRELQRHVEKLQQERKSRMAEIQELTQAMQHLDTQLSDKIQNLDDETKEDFSEVRQALRDEVSQLQMRLREQQDDLLSNLNNETSKLRADKISHQSLSGLFSELGMRLNGDFPITDDN